MGLTRWGDHCRPGGWNAGIARSYRDRNWSIGRSYMDLVEADKIAQAISSVLATAFPWISLGWVSGPMNDLWQTVWINA